MLAGRIAWWHGLPDGRIEVLSGGARLSAPAGAGASALAFGSFDGVPLIT
jgi:hypothetical protein